MVNNDVVLDEMPLCVDLDGTLLKTDSLHELFLLLLKQKPFYCIIAVFWLLKSKAYFKEKISEHVQLSAEDLPYNQDVIRYIESQASGRKILLVTASNKQVAKPIAAHLKLFDEVVASDSTLNLKGDNKRDYLVERFGKGGFEYIGNDNADLSIWPEAGFVSVVSRDNGFYRKFAALLQ